MLGNSSSGIIEAPSFRLPVVNIGDRQKGRLRAENIIDVLECKKDKIVNAIRRAVSKEFRDSLRNLKIHMAAEMQVRGLLMSLERFHLQRW